MTEPVYVAPDYGKDDEYLADGIYAVGHGHLAGPATTREAAMKALVAYVWDEGHAYPEEDMEVGFFVWPPPPEADLGSVDAELADLRVQLADALRERDAARAKLSDWYTFGAQDEARKENNELRTEMLRLMGERDEARQVATELRDMFQDVRPYPGRLPWEKTDD